MIKNLYILFLLFCAMQHTNFLAKAQNLANATSCEVADVAQDLPVKKILDNGLAVIVKSDHRIPGVALQLWYKVGSKDEESHERGMAHLLEHMVFKGTSGEKSLNLSEVDIFKLTRKLSGASNAYTYQDWTFYYFYFPTQHWQEALPVFADSMQHSTFSDEHLNSELKTVIQELKLYKDKIWWTIWEKSLATMFFGHPYEYPIVGFKEDLWNIHGEDLKQFYKKHYTPDNAALVVVGDVNPEEVFALAQKYFGHIKKSSHQKSHSPSIKKDISSKSTILYRDVKQPHHRLVFMIPGLAKKVDHIAYIIDWILAKGMGSRLYKRLIDSEQLVAFIEAEVGWLADADGNIFSISYIPKDDADQAKIEKIIFEEINDIVCNGLKPEELTRAIKHAKVEYLSFQESHFKLARAIGMTYMSSNDELYVFNYLSESPEVIEQKVIDMLSTYFRPAVVHRSSILPLPESEKEAWQKLQQLSDEEDKQILSARVRTQPLEEPNYANKVAVKEPTEFKFPQAKKEKFSNGLQLLYHHDSALKKASIVVELKAKNYYDPEDLQGLYNFMMCMLLEGTEKYSGSELVAAADARGMEIWTNAAEGRIGIECLSEDIEYALDLLQEVITQSNFPEDAIEKVRCKLLCERKSFLDDPSAIAHQLMCEAIYKNHPYSKNNLGTEESINKITRADLVESYKKYVTPYGANIAIVGDVEKCNVPMLVKKHLGSWQGPVVEDLVYPKLEKIKPHEIAYCMNRDQITLCFAGLSISRTHPDYDKLRLFSDFFAGDTGELFKLREKTGIFYTINGSLVQGSDKQPGLEFVKTRVSLDRLEEAENLIKDTINNAIGKMTKEDLAIARRVLVNAMAYWFQSGYNIADNFLFLEKYNFPATYFDERNKVLSKITLEQVKEATAKVLNTDQMLTLRVGRL